MPLSCGTSVPESEEEADEELVVLAMGSCSSIGTSVFLLWLASSSAFSTYLSAAFMAASDVDVTVECLLLALVTFYPFFLWPKVCTKNQKDGGRAEEGPAIN